MPQSIPAEPAHLSSPAASLFRSHMPELDTLRGLAILGVLLYHGLYWARDLSPFSPIQRRILSVASVGQFGVNLFFVLSGFLISGLLLDSKNRPDYYLRFYLRRALRILPSYSESQCRIQFFGRWRLSSIFTSSGPWL